jgi:hypothetical protein
MHHSDFRFGDIFAAAFLVAFFLVGPPSPAISAGALAIGEPKHIEKGGVAVGFAYNYASKDAAEAGALKMCLAFQGAPVATRALCKVVKSYENQCHSIALDPKDGTPGFGWAVMTEQGKADEAALDNCRRTAGKSRVEFCKVTKSACDNTSTSEKSPPRK